MADLQKYVIDVFAISILVAFIFKFGHRFLEGSASAFKEGVDCDLVLCHIIGG